MTLVLSNAAGNAALDAISALLSAGDQIRVYGGTVPASADAALGSAVLLATLTLPNPVAPAATGKQLTINPIPETNASSGGVATFFRVYSGSTSRMQGTVTDEDGNGTLVLNSVDLTLYAVVSVASFIITI